jgi:dolichyl-phosphate beta-glucosyltransferase
MKISVIIPMYNEENIITDTVNTVSDYMKAHFGEGEYEVIFVNDGSRDTCAAMVAAMEIPGIRLVTYEENHGKGYAIRQGVMAAEGDVIMFTDCDLAYGLDVVSEFYTALDNTGYDVAVGSRPKHPEGYAGYTLLRKILSRVYLGVLRVFGGLSLSDSQCGCKAFCKDTGKKIFSYCEIDRFAFDFEAILLGQKIGAKFKEIPVKVINHGESKVRIIRDTLRMLKDLRRMKKRIKKLDIV